MNGSIEAAWAVGAGTARASLELPSGRLEGLHVTWVLRRMWGRGEVVVADSVGVVGQPKF